MMGRMVSDSAKAMDEANNDPLLRLATFVAATLVPPVADPVQIGLWAGFIHSVRHDPKVREVHIQSYLEYRDMLEALIEALPASLGSKKGQAAAIACNGVIDGLWMEASVVPEMFGEKEILTIGLTSVGAILGIELLAAFNRPRDSLT
jgi:TetR/AcrR family transcriptional repressor of bet genes